MKCGSPRAVATPALAAFAPGAHDDLVTAVALAVWRGEHPPRYAGVWGDPSPSSSVRPERGSAGRTVWDTDPFL